MTRSGVLLLLCWVACGCSDDPGYKVPKGVIVAGKVLKGGQPLAVPRADVGFGMIEVALVPENASIGPRETATASSDGSFEVLGMGKGVPPGRYKLAIFQRDKGVDSDALEGAFSDEKTPISVDVTKDKLGGKLDMKVIELDSYAPKK